MEWKLWHEPLAVGFRGENGILFQNLAWQPTADQNSFSEWGKRQWASLCCYGMICPARWAQRADNTTWLSCVAFYHSELRGNPLSTFCNTIYDQMEKGSERRVMVGYVQTDWFWQKVSCTGLNCGCTSQVSIMWNIRLSVFYSSKSFHITSPVTFTHRSYTVAYCMTP